MFLVRGTSRDKMLETEFVSSSEDETFDAPAAESDGLKALSAARDVEVEAATRAHLSQFKTWIVEDEPEPPELLCARIDAHNYTLPLCGYVQPDHNFDAAAMVQHYLTRSISQRKQELTYAYDLGSLRSGVTVRYAIRVDTHPNILKVMRDANFAALSASSTRPLLGGELGRT